MYLPFFMKLLPNNGKSSYNHENSIVVQVRRVQSSAHNLFLLILKHLLDPGRADGFYASRWCNVFYRCVGGVSNAFLCPAQRGGGRLWWIQHGMSQAVSEESAACTYPCDTGRQCSSAGGVIVDNGNQISESQQEAEVAYRQSPCSNQTAQTGTGQTGTGQTGTGQSGTGQTGTGQTGTGQTGTGQTGTGQTGTGQTGTGQTGTGQTGSGQTGGANQGSSSGTGGKLLSSISLPFSLLPPLKRLL